jgi:alkanesulfonate monooxygenase SsuD/methylene tetrahydromethanopterin reductase-like flavin-dependent oxidoreductase (luciferase family)
VRIGVALPQRGWPEPADWSFVEIAEYGTRAEKVGFDSVWASDHFFLDFGGPRFRVGPEPMTALAYLAGRTERITLGTLVLCGAFRSPGQLAREAKTLAELSNGRFVLGIGSGWHQPEFDAFDIPFDRLVSRFEEYTEALVALLAGGPVDYDGRYVKLWGGEVLGGDVPQLWIASAAPRMLQLTAKLADGWNLRGSNEHFPELLQVLRREEVDAGRAPGSVLASCNASALLVEPEEGERLLEQNPPMLGPVAVGAEGLREIAEGHRAAGCQELILHFSGSVWTSYGREQLDLAADALGLSA